MQVTFHVFSRLREITGSSQFTLDVPEGATLALAVQSLMARYPALEGQQAIWHFAVNKTAASEDLILKPGDTISIFTHIAGG